MYREERKAKSEKRPSSYNHLVLPIVLGAAGVAGLATWAGFQTMWPTSQVCGSTFIGLPRGSRQLALTYDDGPNDPYTWRMMEVLERHGVKATFFLLGSFVQQKPEIARALVAAGHAIGSHTWDHPNLIFASSAKIRQQLQQTRQAILDATGVDPTIFRPPFGGRRPASLRIARELGLQPVMWNVSCYDWKAKSAQEIAALARAPDPRRRYHPAARWRIPSHRRRPQPQRGGYGPHPVPLPSRGLRLRDNPADDGKAAT